MWNRNRPLRRSFKMYLYKITFLYQIDLNFHTSSYSPINKEQHQFQTGFKTAAQHVQEYALRSFFLMIRMCVVYMAICFFAKFFPTFLPLFFAAFLPTFCQLLLACFLCAFLGSGGLFRKTAISKNFNFDIDKKSGELKTKWGTKICPKR